MSALLPLAIPSPSTGVWHLGPFPLRAYAFAILLGIVVALWMTRRRWIERGGEPDTTLEIAFWAVPFGIVGGRIYHVITSPDAYFGVGGDPIRALYIWEGGLGIWGAVAFGAIGAWIGCRRQGVRLAPWADALAPGLLVAQALGRLGNWFNQELFGAPTTLPWGLEVSPEVIQQLNEQTGTSFAAGTLFHPTFLYELLWNLGAAAVLVWLDRRYRLGHGRVFWAYVALYTLGRVWIEMLRIDTAEHVLGLRLNVWTSIVVGLGALVAFYVIGRRYPEREDGVELPGRTRAVPTGADDQHDTELDTTSTAHAGAAAGAPGRDDGRDSGTDPNRADADVAGPDPGPADRA